VVIVCGVRASRREQGEDRLARGAGVQRERLADRADGLQALGGDDLVQERDPLTVQNGQIDGLAQLAGKVFQVRVYAAEQLAADRVGHPGDLVAEAVAAAGAGDQALLGERVEDAVDGGARQAQALAQFGLGEAAGCRLQRAHDLGGAGDHLDAGAAVRRGFCLAHRDIVPDVRLTRAPRGCVRRGARR
jgi:hypothetical protein